MVTFYGNNINKPFMYNLIDRMYNWPIYMSFEVCTLKLG